MLFGFGSYKLQAGGFEAGKIEHYEQQGNLCSKRSITYTKTQSGPGWFTGPKTMCIQVHPIMLALMVLSTLIVCFKLL